MATDNEINIKAGLDIDDLDADVDKLIGEVDSAKSEIEGMSDDALEGVKGLDEGILSLVKNYLSLSMIVETGGLTLAFNAALQLVDDINNSLTNTVQQYNDAGEAAVAYFEKIKKGGGSRDKLGDSFADNLSDKDKATLKELGEQSLGYAAKGTALRYFQDLGDTLAIIGSFGAESQSILNEKINAGRGAGQTEFNIRQNEEEYQAKKKLADELAAKEDLKLATQLEKERTERDKLLQKEEDARLAMEDRIAVQKGRLALSYIEELNRFDEQDARKKMQQERQDAMKALGREKDGDKGFASSLESFDSMYRRIQEAAGGTKDDATEKNNRNREEVARKQDELREKWRIEDEGKRATERQDLADKIAAVVGMK